LIKKLEKRLILKIAENYYLITAESRRNETKIEIELGFGGAGEVAVGGRNSPKCQTRTVLRDEQLGGIDGVV
jgi:hypothetical protein